MAHDDSPGLKDGQARARAGRRQPLPQIGRLEGRAADVALVGIGCRLPGGVHDAESFWNFMMAMVVYPSSLPDG